MRDFYALLLNLFPKAYRAEYGDELQAVFYLSLDDARKTGWVEVTGVVLRELINLPKAILYEHLRERRRSKMTGKPASRLDFAPGSRNEALAALTPFLLFGALPALLGYLHKMGAVPLWLDIFSSVVIGALGIGLFGIGFARRVPRWFMPYLGLPLPILCVILFNWMIDPEWRGFPILYGSSWFVRAFVQAGLLWIPLFFMVVLLVLAIRLFPGFRPLYQRLEQDWTLLCFILYGTAPFAIVLTFEEYKNEEPYLILAFLVLAAGGWLYLRLDDSWKKFLSLYVGTALSMFVAAVGKAVLYESSFPVLHFTWQTEMMGAIITWMWLALILLSTIAIQLLPRSDPPAETV